MNRYFHKRRGVVRIDNLHPLREIGLQLGKLCLNRRCGIKGIGAGCELNPEAGSRLTVNFRHHVVVFAAQLDTRDVFQMDHRTVGVHPQRYLTKLLRILQAGLRDDRGVQLLARHRRRSSKLAGGNLIVLHLQLVDDVDRRQVIFIQQIAIKPHAHRVLGAKQLHIANAVETANRILDV